MMKVTLVDHPLLQDKLTRLRNKDTEMMEFRRLVKEITIILLTKASESWRVRNKQVTTPLRDCDGWKLEKEKVVFVPILRAGLGMIEGVFSLVPDAYVGHIGIYRDEELQPEEYYLNLPENLQEMQVVLVDPMLATGGTSLKAVNLLEERGAKEIQMLSLFASPEGIRYLEENLQGEKELDLYIGVIDEKLNDKGYIVPGVGDAGDRMFGTKGG